MSGAPRSLAARRRRLGLTQTQLGALAGLDQARVSRVENGRRDDEGFARIRDALDAEEMRRSQGLHAEADAFWSGTAGAPYHDRVLERLAGIARDLLDGPLLKSALGVALLDCLPDAVRRAALGDQQPLLDAAPPPTKR